MTDQDLVYLSGEEVLKLFHARELSPVAFMKAILEQAHKAHDAVNCVTEFMEESAMKTAQEAEDRYMGKGEAPRALEGLPLAVKEELPLAGTGRSQASLAYKDRVDDFTVVYLQRLIDAGAIPHCKTTTPEFCLLGTTTSKLWGTSRNPWNPQMTTGGSSGGSGALLAAGGTTLATGTDIGGSIRIPAACCGVTGFKAPYGRNPEIAVFNLDYYSHTGPMARTVNDLALMQNITSGQDLSDIASVREKVVLDTESPASLKGMKAAYSFDLETGEVDDQVVANFQKTLDFLADQGVELTEAKLGWPQNSCALSELYLSHVWGRTLLREYEEHGDLLCDYTIDYAKGAAASTSEDLIKANESAYEMYLTLGPYLEANDVFLCPGMAVVGPEAHTAYEPIPYTRNGQPAEMAALSGFLTAQFNMLSRCPVLSVPSGFADNGMPLGVQVVAKPFHDERCIAFGRAYEAAVGGWYNGTEKRPNLA